MLLRLGRSSLRAAGIARRVPSRSFVSTRPLFAEDLDTPAPQPKQRRKAAKAGQTAVKIQDFQRADFGEIEQAFARDFRLIDPAKENLLDKALGESGLVGEAKRDMEKVASYQFASSKELLKRRIANTVQKYQRFEGDTGSTEVIVAVLSERIIALREHMRNNRKDFSTRRGLERLFHDRRRAMKYLKRTRFDMYNRMLVDYNITEEEIWEWGRISGRFTNETRFKGLNEYKGDREKRLAWEAAEKK